MNALEKLEAWLHDESRPDVWRSYSIWNLIHDGSHLAAVTLGDTDDSFEVYAAAPTLSEAIEQALEKAEAL